jgi:hypothetical protein
MQGAKSGLEALDFLTSHDPDDVDFILTQTMVFFDDISLSLDALAHLRAKLPLSRRGEIVAYSSL